jgi:hypothetical protein
MNAVVIEEFTPVIKNTLRGFARVRMPSGVVFHDVAIHRKGDSSWASPASKPMIGRDGQQIKDQAGKPLWCPVVSFASKELRERFSGAVLDALRAAHPEVFDGH